MTMLINDMINTSTKPAPSRLAMGKLDIKVGIVAFFND
jgi:hypothetical protein